MAQPGLPSMNGINELSKVIPSLSKELHSTLRYSEIESGTLKLGTHNRHHLGEERCLSRASPTEHDRFEHHTHYSPPSISYSQLTVADR